jgi:hypothetical protein
MSIHKRRLCASNVHFNIILVFAPRSSIWPRFKFLQPYQNSVWPVVCFQHLWLFVTIQFSLKWYLVLYIANWSSLCDLSWRRTLGVEVWLDSFFNLNAIWGEWSSPCPGRFTPGNDPVPIIQEPGWASGTFRRGAENFAPTGIRSKDRPARSESLYRLRYPDPLLMNHIHRQVEKNSS